MRPGLLCPINRATTGLVTVIFVLSFLFNSCASVGQKPSPKKFTPKTKIERENVPETGAKKEIIRQEPKPVAFGATPKARASAKMVEDGRRSMIAGEYEAAQRAFQDAINIDPGNGVAYYYLAKAKYELGQYEQAGGVLDKAEELLAGSKEWAEAVASLRELIKVD